MWGADLASAPVRGGGFRRLPGGVAKHSGYRFYAGPWGGLALLDRARDFFYKAASRGGRNLRTPAPAMASGQK